MSRRIEIPLRKGVSFPANTAHKQSLRCKGDVFGTHCVHWHSKRGTDEIESFTKQSSAWRNDPTVSTSKTLFGRSPQRKGAATRSLTYCKMRERTKPLQRQYCQTRFCAFLVTLHDATFLSPQCHPIAGLTRWSVIEPALPYTRMNT